MKLGVAGGGGSLFFWSPLTLLAENSNGAALLSRAGPELSHASPTELVKDECSPWVPLEKAGDGAWLPQWRWGGRPQAGLCSSDCGLLLAPPNWAKTVTRH